MKTTFAAIVALLLSMPALSGAVFAQSAGGTAGGSSKAGGPSATVPSSATSGKTAGTGGGRHASLHRHHR